TGITGARARPVYMMPEPDPARKTGRAFTGARGHARPVSSSYIQYWIYILTLLITAVSITKTGLTGARRAGPGMPVCIKNGPGRVRAFYKRAGPGTGIKIRARFEL